MDTTTKTRSIAQDIAKGMMILAVIFFHSYMITFNPPTDALAHFNILTSLFPFILSSFFFYSGYNYTPNERTYGQNIARRAKQLLIPLVVVLVISTILVGAMELLFNPAEALTTLTNIGNTVLYSLMSEPLAIISGFAATHPVYFELVVALGLLWFLYALFFCSLFFFLLVKHTNKSLPTLISTVIGLLLLSFCLGQFVGVYLPYTCQCYPAILAIMLTAAYLRQRQFLDKKVTCKKDVVLKVINALIAEGIVVGTCLVCYFQFGATTTGSLPGGKLDDILKGFDAFIVFGFGILGTYFIHMVSRLIALIPLLGKGLGWMGKHSAIFYLLHPIFLDLGQIALFQKKILFGHAQAYIYVAFIVACLILLCLLIDLLSKRKTGRKAEPEITAWEEGNPEEK